MSLGTILLIDLAAQQGLGLRAERHSRFDPGRGRRIAVDGQAVTCPLDREFEWRQISACGAPSQRPT